MESTLGKRIMHCRKKLGLTQDKLAETLGVTAQAVSKWENDQSCPDITMLPRLAELFGVTTDELLGMKTKQDEAPAVLEGTVEETAPEKEGHNFEMNFEPGKRDAIFMAVFVLFVGTLTLVSVLCEWNVSFWSILWPSAFLAVGVRGFFRKFSFSNIVCTLFGSYFLLENLNITSLDVSWKLIFPVLILLLGLSLFVDALRKPKYNRWNIRHNGKDFSNVDHYDNTVNDYSEEKGHFSCSLTFGDGFRQVNLEQVVSGKVECAFGKLTIDLCGCERFADHCHIDVDCAFGSTTLLLPKSVNVIPNNSTAFAGFEIKGTPNPNATWTIYLDADVSFAAVTVRYE